MLSNESQSNLFHGLSSNKLTFCEFERVWKSNTAEPNQSDWVWLYSIFYTWLNQFNCQQFSVSFKIQQGKPCRFILYDVSIKYYLNVSHFLCFLLCLLPGIRKVTNFTKRNHLPDSLNTISGHFEELEDLSVLFHRYPPRFQSALQSTNCLRVLNSPEMKNKTNKRERAAKSS